ncbi:Uncharacterised protein [Mycobacteroides abscessus subsp. abscessus]|nr:Uncharacterised protein [Mycobacteroides abscessus subsp. abscessus]
MTTLPQFADVDSVPEKVAEVLVSLMVPATNPEVSLIRLVPPDSEPNVPLLPPRQKLWMDRELRPGEAD